MEIFVIAINLSGQQLVKQIAAKAESKTCQTIPKAITILTKDHNTTLWYVDKQQHPHVKQ
jgi:hypothetical protein